MLSEVMVIWSEVIYFSNLGLLVYAISVSIIAHVFVIKVEEPELRKRFGSAYEDYCKRTPRWIPLIKSWN